MLYLAIGYLVGMLTVLIPARIMGKRLAIQRAYAKQDREKADKLALAKAYADGRADQSVQDQERIGNLQQQVDMLMAGNDDLRTQLAADTIFANQLSRGGKGTLLLHRAGGPQ